MRFVIIRDGFVIIADLLLSSFVLVCSVIKFSMRSVNLGWTCQGYFARVGGLVTQSSELVTSTSGYSIGLWIMSCWGFLLTRNHPKEVIESCVAWGFSLTRNDLPWQGCLDHALLGTFRWPEIIRRRFLKRPALAGIVESCVVWFFSLTRNHPYLVKDAVCVMTIYSAAYWTITPRSPVMFPRLVVDRRNCPRKIRAREFGGLKAIK